MLQVFSFKNCYRYGFNGQEKVNEVAGVGNHTTALYGEYDPRTAGRWNLDPKPNPSVSPYSMFGGNPIANRDVLLDTPIVSGTASQVRKFESQINRNSPTQFKVNSKGRLLVDGKVNNKGVEGKNSGELSELINNSVKSTKNTYFNLVENDNEVFGDSYKNGTYDVGDIEKFGVFKEFQAAVIGHIFSERSAAPDYKSPKNDMTDFPKYHDIGKMYESLIRQDYLGENSGLYRGETQGPIMLGMFKYSGFDYGGTRYTIFSLPSGTILGVTKTSTK